MLRLLAVLLIAFSLLPAAASAQGLATLKGLVEDPAGAAISKAKIVVVQDLQGCPGPPYKHPKKAKTFKASTDDTGKYTLSLAPGKYEVIVSMWGYQDVCKDLDLPASGATADFKLNIGPTKM